LGERAAAKPRPIFPVPMMAIFIPDRLDLRRAVYQDVPASLSETSQ
jgi:hypothetical protein